MRSESERYKISYFSFRSLVHLGFDELSGTNNLYKRNLHSADNYCSQMTFTAATQKHLGDQSDNNQYHIAATNDGNRITTRPTRLERKTSYIGNCKHQNMTNHDPILSNGPPEHPPPPIDFKGRLGKRATVNRTAHPVEALKSPLHNSASFGRGYLVEAVVWQADGEDPAAWGRMLAALS